MLISRHSKSLEIIRKILLPSSQMAKPYFGCLEMVQKLQQLTHLFKVCLCILWRKAGERGWGSSTMNMDETVLHTTNDSPLQSVPVYTLEESRREGVG